MNWNCLSKYKFDLPSKNVDHIYFFDFWRAYRIYEIFCSKFFIFSQVKLEMRSSFNFCWKKKWYAACKSLATRPSLAPIFLKFWRRYLSWKYRSRFLVDIGCQASGTDKNEHDEISQDVQALVSRADSRLA